MGWVCGKPFQGSHPVSTTKALYATFIFMELTLLIPGPLSLNSIAFFWNCQKKYERFSQTIFKYFVLHISW